MSEKNFPAPAWTGWGWRQGKWVRLCQSATLADCSATLERVRGRIPGHHTVCVAGGSPPRFEPKEG